MTKTITVDERRARLARRHLLLPEHRTDDVAAIADAVVALHSSDPVTVYLSAAARMRTPSFDAVEAALYDERTVVRHHAMRRTLWVATPDVARAMHAAATRRLVGPEERRTLKLLADNGIDDPVAWLADARAQALAALHEHGPMNARQLGERVPALRHPIQMAPGKSYGAVAAAHTRVLLSLGFEGEVLRTRPSGTWVNGAYTYAATDTWLDGGLGELKEDEAAATLAHRWLARFGPATTADLQWWMGWTVTLTKRALADSGAVAGRDRAAERPGGRGLGRPRRRADGAGGPVGGGPAQPRPDDDGLEAPGLVPRPRLRRRLRPQRQRRPHHLGRRPGRRRLGADQGRRAAQPLLPRHDRPAASRRRRRARAAA